MARFRKLVRQAKWASVDITMADKAKHNTDHLTMLGWAQDIAGLDDVQAVLRKTNWSNAGYPAVSTFAFKDPTHALIFRLKWK